MGEARGMMREARNERHDGRMGEARGERQEAWCEWPDNTVE
jgi:hypothetical protein